MILHYLIASRSPLGQACGVRGLAKRCQTNNKKQTNSRNKMARDRKHEKPNDESKQKTNQQKHQAL